MDVDHLKGMLTDGNLTRFELNIVYPVKSTLSALESAMVEGILETTVQGNLSILRMGMEASYALAV